jgi:hypothetical protein
VKARICARWELRPTFVNQPESQELKMSGINGDKARFHRERKQKIARRKRTRELWKSLAEGRKLPAAASVSKPKAVSA